MTSNGSRTASTNPPSSRSRRRRRTPGSRSSSRSTARASSWPWRGVNALNAVISLFNALDAMRQQIHTGARIHGVITKGGDQANIIPEYTSAEFYLRATTVAYCRELLRRFTAAADGAAAATGCRVQVTPDPTLHEPLKANTTMADALK